MLSSLFCKWMALSWQKSGINSYSTVFTNSPSNSKWRARSFVVTKKKKFINQRPFGVSIYMWKSLSRRGSSYCLASPFFANSCAAGGTGKALSFSHWISTSLVNGMTRENSQYNWMDWLRQRATLYWKEPIYFGTKRDNSEAAELLKCGNFCCVLFHHLEVAWF